ncbi:ankyrin repeat and SAM domain-containing protein 1A-like isoform X1 [Amphibalanus amphitrite]|uniref:ankyrin repeat and SAM domain-containing protein 1A-like isoform X1 n=1 Tax=Amphibalanus amphitrite TaxID=1232801 RepID=UPI001C924D14|nr:ankyrin repeat and SAM domain-containing protein 1A-like isoform X1 [Amphibalanus amphitrite]
MGKDQELLDAARNGHYAAVEKILLQRTKRSGPLASLRRGPGPNIQDPSGYTALHHAALNGHRDVVALLMSHEASVNLADHRGSTPLHLAAWTGSVEVVRTLITHGPGIANVDCVNKDHETPLHSACQYGHTAVVRLLLEHSCDASVPNCRGETPLDLAAQYGRLEAAELLVRVRPGLLEPYRPGAQPPGQRLTHTPLHSAAMNGHRAVVKLLLDSGMDVNCSTAAGTALFEAALCGKVEVVRCLLAAGVDISILDDYGRDVLTLLNEISTPVTAKIRQLIQGRDRLVDVDPVEDAEPTTTPSPLPPPAATSPGSPYENVLLPSRVGSEVAPPPGRQGPVWPIYDIPPSNRRSRAAVVSKSSDELNGIEFESPIKRNSRGPMFRSHSYDVDKLTDTESDPDPGVDPGLDPIIDTGLEPPSPPVKTRHQSSNSSSADGSRHQSAGSSVDGSRHQSTGSSIDGSIGRSSGVRVSARVRSLEADGSYSTVSKPVPPPKPPRRSIAASPPTSDAIYELLAEAQSGGERAPPGGRRAYENISGFWRQQELRQARDDIGVTCGGRARVKDRRRNRTNVYENHRPGETLTWAAPGRRPTESAAPADRAEQDRGERMERAQEPIGGRRSPRPISVSGAGAKPVPPPRVSSRLRVRPLSPSQQQQPPTPDHPPPSASHAAQSISDKIRPPSQQDSVPPTTGQQRTSRDMETETEEELLQLQAGGSGSSDRSSPSAPGSDLSASTDNIEEVQQDAPFAGLYRGSVIGLLSDAPVVPVPAPRRPDRPTTLPAYENVRMSSSATTAASGASEPDLVLRRGRTSAGNAATDQRVSSLVILSPFNEQEEWNKVYDIVASYGDGIMSEIDQELQNRRAQENRASAGGGISSLLRTLGLARYELRLLELGYDDLEFVRGVLDESDLLQAGVDEPEARATLLSAAVQLPDGISRARQLAAAADSVPGWLRALRLEQYSDVFSRSLYTDMQRVRKVWEMELVTVLEVTKPGHLKRMLLSLRPTEEKEAPTERQGADPGAELSDLDSKLARLQTDLEDLPITDERDRDQEESLFKDYTLPRPSPDRSSQERVSQERASQERGSQERRGAERTNGHGKTPPPPPPAKPSRRRGRGSSSGSGEDRTAVEDGAGGDTLRRQQEALKIRDPSQLVVGVPAVMATQWRHEPHHLVNSSIQYIAEYLGSTLVKEVRGTESTRKSIQKLKKTSSQMRKVPRIVLSISHSGVRFLDAHTQKLVCEHEIRNIHCACQDADDLSHFAYITKDLDTRCHYCHVFRVQTMDLATEIILTLGQAFEVAYQLAIRERALLNQSDDSKLALSGHHRSQSAQQIVRPAAAATHARSHSVNQITTPAVAAAPADDRPPPLAD